MKSEEARARAHPWPDVVAELDKRTRDAQPGDAVDLASLCAQDPCGPAAFAQIASRFGASRDAEGRWALQRLPRWRPAWLRPEDAQPFFTLFETAFGYRMDAKLWAWKYRDTTRPGMGAWKDDRLIAFYGAIPRQVLMFGKPESCVQIGDVMVHPSERGVMTRSGALGVVAASYLERSVGFGRPHLLAFGFPTKTALILPKKLGLYEQVDQMSELVWPAGVGWTSRMLRSDPAGPSDDATIDRLWQLMAADFRTSILGVRDAAYVAQRYRSHPSVAYECLMIRSRLTRKPLGVAVLRLVDADLAELVDLIGPKRSFPALVAAARRWAHLKGIARIRAWVTSSHVELLSRGATGVTPMDLAVPTNAWTPGPTPDELRDRWWLMAGDTDFR